jgi:hypothetical protein
MYEYVIMAVTVAVIGYMATHTVAQAKAAVKRLYQ